MNTTTNTRGVSEAMRDAVAKAVADVIGHGMREKCYAHADAAIAALSAEPAAQGDGLCQRNPAPNAAPAVGMTSTQHIVYLSPEGTAPPAQPAERVPDGWKLVPIDATPAMQAAGGHANSEWLNDNAPIGESRYGGPVMRSVWEAMLAASPAPSEEGDGKEVCRD